ncbi:hypothetical protein J21TS3_14340 [Paenibacillus cookii]|uniref:Uncharacterized protein n=1 Tax=Paenibacillus cookii TaxID=157839 RepID=A0ABQ4LTY2_9BACL|nr:hypothetical protein J21TS3_14340 [Paenibacillus cookii]
MLVMISSQVQFEHILSYTYFELYRNGTFLGSKQDESNNYYLDKSAAALISDKTHSQSGLYTMTWSGRIGGYYWNGSDWTDAGETSYYLN